MYRYKLALFFLLEWLFKKKTKSIPDTVASLIFVCINNVVFFERVFSWALKICGFTICIIYMHEHYLNKIIVLEFAFLLNNKNTNVSWILKTPKWNQSKNSLNSSLEHRLLDSLVVECWLWVREVPGSISSQGPRHTKDVMKMVPVILLFSTQHWKGNYWLFLKN